MKNNDLTNAVIEIVKAIKEDDTINSKWLDSFVRSKNRQTHDKNRIVSKRRLMPEYLRIKNEEEEILRKLCVDAEIDRKIINLLRAKPRRTASGVATITVLMKPWPCSGNCVFCPNDIRMPKSYIHNEPACQRAKRWNFDPYLQVISRVYALQEMGHNIDKIELIVLGGTFSDYEQEYQIWFVKELFRACNEFEEKGKNIIDGEINTEEISQLEIKENKSLKDNEETYLDNIQEKIEEGNISYNQAWEMVYSKIEKETNYECTTLEELKHQQKINEDSLLHVVGLVVETRPDKAKIEDLMFLRKLGCTKIQLGIQTLNDKILKNNCRNISLSKIKDSMNNVRLLGFKSHVHIMPNLIGATPSGDKRVYEELMTDESFKPDEVKIYPCCLVKSARLKREYENGNWKPYTEKELLSVVVSNIACTPPHTRISRMIRDISTTDIIAGNKKPNLRQLVEEELSKEKATRQIQEMRFREIGLDEVSVNELKLQDETYLTANTTEHFLQWVTENNRLAGFLRLSLPKPESTRELSDVLGNNSAMIREVHIYGKVEKIHKRTAGAQHQGLGKKLIERACEIAKQQGYENLNVISAVGTRQYYRSLGFKDTELYQRKDL